MIQDTILLILLGGSLTVLVFTVRNSSCGKVIFSHVSVCPQVGRAWQVGMHGRGCVLQGPCMAGRVCMAGGHAWQGTCVAAGVMYTWQEWCGRGWHGRGVYITGGHMWKGVACMAGRHVWQGACVARGCAWWGCAWQGAFVAGWRGHAYQGGMHAWQERLPLQRTVRILLECILVLSLLVTCMLNVKTKNRLLLP